MTNTNPNQWGRCFYCRENIRFGEETCRWCGRKNDKWIAPDYSCCGNCNARLAPEDRYCRICGTKAGEGTFDPIEEIMQCIYGPEPVERKHVCQKCGYTWTTCAMVDRENYCPKCGGPAPYLEDDFFFFPD